MKVKVKESIKISPNVMVMPLPKGDDLTQHLTTVSKKTGIPVELIKADFSGKLKRKQ